MLELLKPNLQVERKVAIRLISTLNMIFRNLFTIIYNYKQL